MLEEKKFLLSEIQAKAEEISKLRTRKYPPESIIAWLENDQRLKRARIAEIDNNTISCEYCHRPLINGVCVAGCVAPEEEPLRLKILYIMQCWDIEADGFKCPQILTDKNTGRHYCMDMEKEIEDPTAFPPVWCPLEDELEREG